MAHARMIHASIRTTEEAIKAVILQIRISILLDGLARLNEAWETLCVKDGHNITDDYSAICNILAINIATNDAEARTLVKEVADRWGIDVSIVGVDDVDLDGKGE